MISFKKIAFLFFLISLNLVFSVERSRVLMGTYATIKLPNGNNDQITAAFNKIQAIENVLSSYDSRATLFLLNKKHAVPYDPVLAEAIEYSKKYYDATNGFFDITIGSITKKLYHFGEDKTYSPAINQLKNAYLNIEGIHVSHEIIQTDKNITIDFGGIGKGYAIDKVASYFSDQNISEGMVSLSGDIRCFNECTVYLQSPYASLTFAKVSSKYNNLSISTSGTYERYATIPSEHHLLNPKTAVQGRDFISVSLFSTANNTKIDAYATAISVMSKQEAMAFLEKLDDVGFIVVDSDGVIFYGNLNQLVDFEFLDYKEIATIHNIDTNNNKKINKEKTLIHPDTTRPIMIKP